MEELAALEGQRVALMLANTGGSVAGVLYAVDPWTKAVLLVQEPDAQQHQQLQQGEGDGQLQNSGAIRKSSKSQLPTCIYVEGGQIKSWVVDPKSSNVAEGAAGSGCIPGSSECVPTLAADGQGNLDMVAKDGTVMFETGSCAPTDLCELSLQLRALLDKLS